MFPQIPLFTIKGKLQFAVGDKMKLFIATDFTVNLYDGKYYYYDAFFKILSRYYEKFGKVIVCTRVKKLTVEPTKLKEASHMIEKVVPCNGLIDAFTGEIKSKMKAEIQNCDMVVSRVPSIIAYRAAECAKELNKLSYAEVMGCAWDAYWNHSIVGKIIAPYMLFKMKKTVREADYALYVTNEFLQKRYPTNGKNVGVSDVVLKADMSDEILSNRLKRQKDQCNKLVLGTAAAVDVKYKGQAYVIKAIAYLKKLGYDNFEYQLAGNGDNTRLKNLAIKYGIEDKVKFLGPVPHEKIFDWFDSLDVYVQPSLTEGLPRAVVEAMSRALPCICMNSGGMPELIESKYICKKTGNIARNLSEKILEIINAENMESSSEYNFIKSKEFEEKNLSLIRDNFMLDIINNC